MNCTEIIDFILAARSVESKRPFELKQTTTLPESTVETFRIIVTHQAFFLHVMRLKTIRTSDQASKALFLMKVFCRFCLYAVLVTTESFPKNLWTARNLNDQSYFVTFIASYFNSYV